MCILSSVVGVFRKRTFKKLRIQVGWFLNLSEASKILSRSSVARAGLDLICSLCSFDIGEVEAIHRDPIKVPTLLRFRKNLMGLLIGATTFLQININPGLMIAENQIPFLKVKGLLVLMSMVILDRPSHWIISD